MSEADDKILAHLNTFSVRAMQVLAAARLKAGRRGAGAIELGDMLLGLIVSNQGTLGVLFAEDMHEENRPLPHPPHRPFFSPETADKLLTGIESFLPRLEPIGQTIELPLSHDVQLAFDEAEEIKSTFRHKQIEPLHLLAALLTQQASECVKVLLGAGITREQVLQKLRATDQDQSDG